MDATESQPEVQAKSKLNLEPIKGTRDFYPEEMRWRNWLFDTCRRVSLLYGYEEWDAPFLEMLELYAAKSGEELVNGQTYTFVTRGGDRVAIRPEATPSLARLVARRQNALRKPIRWFTIPNIWRFENNQRGRKREFYQYNADILGVESMEAEAEILALVIQIMREFGLTKDEFVVRISNRYYLDYLLTNLDIDLSLKEGIYHEIDNIEKLKPEDFRGNLLKVGLTTTQIEQLETALREKDFGDFPALNELWQKLEQYGLKDYVEFDPSIVRGLLYYTGTVFEVWDKSKDFRRAVMGGGRYDNLVTALGGQPLPAVGIAFSDVVIEEMLKQYKKFPTTPRELDVYVAQYSAEQRPQAIQVAAQLRAAGLRTELNILGNKLDKQLKAAADSGARWAVILAPDELARGEVNVKDLRNREQKAVKIEELAETLKDSL